MEKESVYFWGKKALLNPAINLMEQRALNFLGAASI